VVCPFKFSYHAKEFEGSNDKDEDDDDNSIQFFIISVLHQQPEGQLQMPNNNNRPVIRLQ
jgi:hypothetical protein